MLQVLTDQQPWPFPQGVDAEIGGRGSCAATQGVAADSTSSYKNYARSDNCTIRDDEERERLHRGLDQAITSVRAGRTVDGDEVINRFLSRP